MYSYTIKSSAPKSTNPHAERPVRAGNNLKKTDNAVNPAEEAMTKGFDTDGFSKTSKVHASKKPLTVAKAPSFGRTTSRVGQPTTSEPNSPRKDSQSKSTQPVRPPQTPKAGAPPRVPRTATPTQSSLEASKAGTPLQGISLVLRPTHAVSGKRLFNTSTQVGVRSPGSGNAAPDLDAHKPEEVPVNDEHSRDQNGVQEASGISDLQSHQGSEGLKHAVAVKDGEIRDLQAQIQILHTAKDAEIQELQGQIKDVLTTNEQRNEQTEASILAQIGPLESEVDAARKTISDLEATHRKTREEHNKALSLKDEEIQKLLGTAHGLRGEQEVKESVLSLKDEFQRLKTQHKRELDEAAATASAEVEVVRAEHDALLQSRDQEVKEMSDLVQELQEKVEKAHQADKDEFKEAESRHKQEIQDKVERHEEELREATTKHQQTLRDGAVEYERNLRNATRRCEELQDKVSRHEQELQDAIVKHVQEMNGAEEAHQKTLHDTNQSHEQEFRNTASRYQQEAEDLMLTHHEEIKTARMRNEQASEESAAKHQREIEALIAKHQEELETAAARQEQAFGDIAAKYQQEFQSLEAKHLDELRTATNGDEQESGTLAAKHELEIQAMTTKHQEQLRETVKTNELESGNAAIKSQHAIEAIIAKHREELAKAASQIEELRAVTQRDQQELGTVATGHKQELESMTQQHQQELHEMTTKNEHELEEAKAKHRELEGGSLREEVFQEAAQKHDEEKARLLNQLETAATNVVSLETTLRDLNIQREESSRVTASKYEQELRTETLKYEEELQSLRTIYATAVEEITALRLRLQDVKQKQSEAVREELQSLRTIYATAVEEITALRRKVEDMDQKRSEAVDEVASLKASFDNVDLKRSEAVSQLNFAQSLMKDKGLEQTEAAVEITLLKDKLELADRRFEQDQQAVSDLQRQIRGLQAHIAELTTNTTLDQNEAAVDAALLRDKLELADLEIHLHKGTISALQNETERLRTELAEQSADTKLNQNEAVVDVALLKDKLELADIQIRQAKGMVSNLQEEIEGLKVQITNSTVGMELDPNEAVVEIALLKNTLELSNLESHQDKTTITTLQKQIEGLQAQVADTPGTGSYTHHQLRGELSMLERHQAAQMTDLESLKADMAAESEVREQEWKKRADVWDRFASELQGLKTHLVGTVGGSSRADSTE